MRYQKPDVIERTDIGFPQGLGRFSKRCCNLESADIKLNLINLQFRAALCQQYLENL